MKTYLLWTSLVIPDRAPVTPLLTLHLLPSLLVLRSVLIASQPSGLYIASLVVEIVFWVAVINVPYAEPLDRILDGAVSHGGGSSGAGGKKLPHHIEDPTCMPPLGAESHAHAQLHSRGRLMDSCSRCCSGIISGRSHSTRSQLSGRMTVQRLVLRHSGRSWRSWTRDMPISRVQGRRGHATLEWIFCAFSPPRSASSV